MIDDIAGPGSKEDALAAVTFGHSGGLPFQQLADSGVFVGESELGCDVLKQPDPGVSDDEETHVWIQVKQTSEMTFIGEKTGPPAL
jgi:hypothetical protein